MIKAYSINTALERNSLRVNKSEDHKKMEEEVIEIFPSIKKHRFYGFGGALTHASGYVLNNMKKKEALEIISNYYSPDKMDYKFVRVPLDSCDFSSKTFNAASSICDIENNNFSFEKDEEFIFPWLDSINKVAGTNIPIVLSPWSPPAFMKDNNSRLKGGSLKKEMYSYWAYYMARYALEYKTRGYNVWAMTIQNEPNAAQTWDSCMYSAKEERQFLTEHLSIELKKLGLEEIKVFFWDHNKERLIARSEEFFDGKDIPEVSGIAFHGYCGDHFKSLEIYKKKHPNHRIVMSEFCMGYKDRFDFKKQLYVYSHEYINDIKAGADTIIDWNLILDSNGGPNHVKNYCIAPVMVDKHFHANKNMTYGVMSALTQVVKDEDTILESSEFDSSLDFLSVKSKNGKIKCVIGCPDKKSEINIRINKNVFSFTIKENTISVLEIEVGDYE